MEDLGARIGRHFARSEPRRRAAGCVRGLLSGTQRKNGWQLAEHLGEATPKVKRSIAAGVPARWVTADAVYGSDYRFRSKLEGLKLSYVVGVCSD
jgi:hypothetical protein